MELKTAADIAGARKLIEDKISEPGIHPAYICQLVAMSEAIGFMDRIMDRLREIPGITELMPGHEDAGPCLRPDRYKACIEGVGRGIAASLASGIMKSTPIGECEHSPPCPWEGQAALFATALSQSAYDYLMQVFMECGKLPPSIDDPAKGSA